MDNVEFFKNMGVTIIEKDGIFYVSKVNEYFIQNFTDFKDIKTEEQLHTILNNNTFSLGGSIIFLTDEINSSLAKNNLKLDEFVKNVYIIPEYRKYKISKLKNGH
jgi:hypothetical protein